MPTTNALPATKSSRRRAKALLALVSVALTLLAGEVVLRVLDLPRVGSFGFLGAQVEDADFVSDPQLFWRLRRSSPTYQVNRHALRGPWPQHRKTARDLRVVCVGDSCTFGVGQRLDQTYGMRLEQLLIEALPGRNVATTLLACSGYSTDQNRQLIERHVAELQPDLTVFYVGAWNDFVVAVGLSDAARRASVPRLRLIHLVQRGLGVGRGRSGVDYRAEFAAGRAPDGRRVPLAEFRRNLEAMIAAVRGVGSRVLVVLPPTPDETLRAQPVSAAYRDVLRQVGRSEGVDFVDAQRRFETFVAGVPEGFRTRENGLGLLFDDWIHPSSIGHAQLAAALFEAVAPALATWRAPLLVGPGPVIGTLRPPAVACPVGEFLVRGEWQAPAGEILERVWLGARVVARFAIEGQQLEFAPPGDLAPGAYPLRVATARGVFATGRHLTVTPAPLQLELWSEGGDIVGRVSLRGRPGASVYVWFAGARCAAPIPTRFGDFGLQPLGEGARPRHRADLPFGFDKVGLLRMLAKVGEDGVARLSGRVPRAVAAQASSLHAQALVLDQGPFGELGYLTEVVSRAIPE